MTSSLLPYHGCSRVRMWIIAPLSNAACDGLRRHDHCTGALYALCLEGEQDSNLRIAGSTACP